MCLRLPGNCGHTFCAACLFALVDQNQDADVNACPACRQSLFETLYDNRDDFERQTPNNETARHLLKVCKPNLILRDLIRKERQKLPPPSSEEAAASLLRVLPFDSGEERSLSLLKFLKKKDVNTKDDVNRTLFWYFEIVD
jgi:hypothetical protein